MLKEDRAIHLSVTSNLFQSLSKTNMYYNNSDHTNFRLQALNVPYDFQKPS